MLEDSFGQIFRVADIIAASAGTAENIGEEGHYDKNWWALVDDLRTVELEPKHLRALFMNGGSEVRKTHRGFGGPAWPKRHRWP